MAFRTVVGCATTRSAHNFIFSETYTALSDADTPPPLARSCLLHHRLQPWAAPARSTARLERLAQALQDQVQTWQLAPVVNALQGRRGVPCTGAVTMGAVRGTLTRLEHPRQLMRYRGLTPLAYASGERRRQGGIIKDRPREAGPASAHPSWYPWHASCSVRR
jgi:hypothetical protein